MGVCPAACSRSRARSTCWRRSPTSAASSGSPSWRAGPGCPADHPPAHAHPARSRLRAPGAVPGVRAGAPAGAAGRERRPPARRLGAAVPPTGGRRRRRERQPGDARRRRSRVLGAGASPRVPCACSPRWAGVSARTAPRSARRCWRPCRRPSAREILGRIGMPPRPSTRSRRCPAMAKEVDRIRAAGIRHRRRRAGDRRTLRGCGAARRAHPRGHLDIRAVHPHDRRPRRHCRTVAHRDRRRRWPTSSTSPARPPAGRSADRASRPPSVRRAPPGTTGTSVPVGDRAPRAELQRAIHHDAGPIWQARDGSAVKGTVRERIERPGTIPELTLSAEQIGADHGLLAGVDTIRRINTTAGWRRQAPARSGPWRTCPTPRRTCSPGRSPAAPQAIRPHPARRRRARR